jgi:hypothetical protein
VRIKVVGVGLELSIAYFNVKTHHGKLLPYNPEIYQMRVRKNYRKSQSRHLRCDAVFLFKYR